MLGALVLLAALDCTRISAMWAGAAWNRWLLSLMATVLGADPGVLRQVLETFSLILLVLGGCAMSAVWAANVELP